MSAKPKTLPIDPYADLDGPVVSQQLIDDVMSASPSPEARAWLERSRLAAEGDEARPAKVVLQDMRKLIDRIEAARGG